jgi:pantetheine-phosphate adenylyltransferase
MSHIALYAGSFDPVTRGHLDLMRRSLHFVDQLVVAVATNPKKSSLFSAPERVRFIADVVADEPRIVVREFGGLLVELAHEVGASMLIRGLRAVSDFEYEFQMALMNRHLAPELETVFMVPSLDTTYISSSMVREVARFGGDLSGLTHASVVKALHEKFRPMPS